MTKQNIFLSIIVPVYNAENKISFLIDSIINQIVSYNYELLLINDGSTDNTLDILEKYTRENKNIIVKSQKNEGAPAARNTGLKIAKGDYIYFVDADDKLDKKILEKIKYYLKEYDPDILIGGFHIFRNDEIIQTVSYRKEMITRAQEKYFKLINESPIPGNKVFSNEFLKNSNLTFFDTKIGQDLNFYLKALASAEKVLLINENMYEYYEWEGSISRTFTAKILDIIKSVEDAENYIVNNNPEMKLNKMFDAMKFKHYYQQYSKIPFISDKEERELVNSELKKEILKFKFAELFTSFDSKTLQKAKLKLKFSGIHKSRIYSSIAKRYL